MKVVCVIAAFNEEKRIVSVIKNSKKFVNTVIVVDDGSNDRTAEVSKKAGAKVIRYENNQGKGYATKIGLNTALKMNPDIIIFLDADGQHEPKYIPFFINSINNGADYVYGLRDLSNYPFDRKIGNWGLKTLTNLLCHTRIQDTECGYRALSLKAAKKIRLIGNRYELEMDFAYDAWRNKFKIKQIEIEVPIFYQKTAIKRGIKNFFYLMKRRFGLI